MELLNKGSILIILSTFLAALYTKVIFEVQMYNNYEVKQDSRKILNTCKI